MKKHIPCLTDDQLENIIFLKAEYFSEYLPETRLNNDLADFIRKCSQTISTVLVTSCRQRRAIETLRYHNLLGCFARLICREELPEAGSLNKYTDALTLMGTNPDAVLVCENEIADIERAALAGVPRENIISIGRQS